MNLQSSKSMQSLFCCNDIICSFENVSGYDQRVCPPWPVLLQIMSILTFAAACAAAGITVLIDNDLNGCANNPCVQFETATSMVFIAWLTSLPSFLLNFWSLASRWMIWGCSYAEYILLSCFSCFLFAAMHLNWKLGFTLCKFLVLSVM